MKLVIALLLSAVMIIESGNNIEKTSIIDQIGLKLDQVERHTDLINEVCLSQETCCQFAEIESSNRYLRHSLIIEGIRASDEEVEPIKLASKFADQLNFQNFTLNTILKLHELVLNGSSIGGKIRNKDVAVQHPVTLKINLTPSHNVVAKELEKFFKWSIEEVIDLHPILRAALIKLNFLKIHPFSDGNGRLSRVLFNWIMRSEGYRGWTTFPSNMIEEYYDVLSAETFDLNLYLIHILKLIQISQNYFLFNLEGCIDSN